ncbi:MAG TPA: response regulator, partial [Chthoniobacteraceae bacterium]
FAEFTQGLYQTPEQINSSTLRTVTQTIEFLGSLMKERGLAQFKDPAKAHVYVVDDDEENCHCIQLALQQQMMRTSISQDPSLALMELAGGRYDLIMLDVSMPGMDGFALCKSIRELPLHANTPVVFLTGLSTIENRVQSTLCGGNEFIAKPFSLNELSVKVLSLILRSELAGN